MLLEKTVRFRRLVCLQQRSVLHCLANPNVGFAASSSSSPSHRVEQCFSATCWTGVVSMSKTVSILQNSVHEREISEFTSNMKRGNVELSEGEKGLEYKTPHFCEAGCIQVKIKCLLKNKLNERMFSVKPGSISCLVKQCFSARS